MTDPEIEQHYQRVKATNRAGLAGADDWLPPTIHADEQLTAEAMLTVDGACRYLVSEDEWVAYAEGRRTHITDHRVIGPHVGRLVTIEVDRSSRPLADQDPGPEPLLFMVTSMEVAEDHLVVRSLRPVEIRWAL